METSAGKKSILVVDDIPDNLVLLSALLRSEYRVKAVSDGKSALEMAKASPQPDLILLDIMMPKMDGYEVCQHLKANPKTAHIPVIFVTSMNEVHDEVKGLALGAVDYVAKPFQPAVVKARVKTHLTLSDYNHALEEKVRERTRELTQSRLETIRSLARAAEYRDNETGLHVVRVSHYVRVMAEHYSTDRQWSNLIFHAAPMHDIGKIGVPDDVLLKPGKLTNEEWAVIRQHPEIGADILGDYPSDLMIMAKEIALSHHEKWDGSGYPKGLKGESIPFSGRMTALADVFDALTNTRPYKPAWSVEKVLDYMNEQRRLHFDPSLVTLFLAVMPEILAVKEEYGEPRVLDGSMGLGEYV